MSTTSRETKLRVLRIIAEGSEEIETTSMMSLGRFAVVGSSDGELIGKIRPAIKVWTIVADIYI